MHNVSDVFALIFYHIHQVKGLLCVVVGLSTAASLIVTPSTAAVASAKPTEDINAQPAGQTGMVWYGMVWWDIKLIAYLRTQ